MLFEKSDIETVIEALKWNHENQKMECMHLINRINQSDISTFEMNTIMTAYWMYQLNLNPEFDEKIDRLYGALRYDFQQANRRELLEAEKDSPVS